MSILSHYSYSFSYRKPSFKFESPVDSVTDIWRYEQFDVTEFTYMYSTEYVGGPEQISSPTLQIASLLIKMMWTSESISSGI